MIKITFITLLISFICEGIMHGYLKKNINKYSNHWHSFNILQHVFLISSCIFYFYSVDILYNKLDIWYDTIKLLIMIVISRWLVFNYTLNIVSKGIKFISYYSARGMDKFYTKYISKIFPPSFIFVLKLFILIITFIAI
jgi:hypothetical protein